MVPYFLGIPLALAATGAFARFLDAGRCDRLAAGGGAPEPGVPRSSDDRDGGRAPPAACRVCGGDRRSRGGHGERRQTAEADLAFAHVAVWLIPVVVLAVNAFWWLPGIWLAETKGPSDFAFAHPEGVLQRLAQIVSTEAPIECVLIAAGLPGLFLLLRRSIAYSAGRRSVSARPGSPGATWPARAGHSTSCSPAGIPTRSSRCSPWPAAPRCTKLFKRLRGASQRQAAARSLGDGRGLADRHPPDRLSAAIRRSMLLAAVCLPEPFLSSRPSPRALWVVDRVGRHLKPGERLLYEEGGFGSPRCARSILREDG